MGLVRDAGHLRPQRLGELHARSRLVGEISARLVGLGLALGLGLGLGLG